MRLHLPGLLVAYTDEGEGRPLLLLHGFPLSRRLWRPQVADLAATTRVLAPDLRGHGQSDVTAGPYSVEQYADDAARLLDALNVTQPVIVAGLSMGGYIALAFQRRHPQRVAGLILAATRAGADSAEGKAKRDEAAAAARAHGARAIVDAMLPKMLAPRTYQTRPDLVAEARALMAPTKVTGIVSALAALRDRPDATKQLATIRQPVLVLHGSDDQLIAPSEAEAMTRALPNSRLALLAGGGHLLNLEQPAAFNAAVRTFAASL
ncbi:MAG: alpha/beta fold hydrolase [Anaerolineales bacterium]|nr:alpha/beta fold hydrolase [Anaerolineales bacterium]